MKYRECRSVRIELAIDEVRLAVAEYISDRAKRTDIKAEHIELHVIQDAYGCPKEFTAVAFRMLEDHKETK